MDRKQQAKEIFAILSHDNPNPTTELVYNSEFELLVAVVLSAQATDVGVNKATKVLYQVANTPEKIISIGQEKLEQYIKKTNKNADLSSIMNLEHESSI